MVTTGVLGVWGLVALLEGRVVWGVAIAIGVVW